MRFKKLKYFNFRNISNGFIDTDSGNVVLEGVNGQGKTNILESVYILAYGSSFRTGNIREAISFGCSRMHIAAEVEDDGGQIRKVDYINEQGKRRILLDGKDVRDRKELVYSFPVIVFSHEDIDFLKGEPEYRRRFFDQIFSMYDPVYLDSLRKFKSILSQRNSAIKSGQHSLISLYDGRLADYGLEVMEKRRSGVESFNEIFPSIFRQISGLDRNIRIRYQPSWRDLSSTDEVLSYLDSTRERDINLQTTSSGVHRDRFTVVDDNGPFVQTGSTGQLRLASVLLRLAQARFFHQMTEKKPVLLIDDVLLELDSAKRASFLSMLDNYSQAFFTFLPEEKYFRARKEDIIEYVVEDGKVTEKA